MKQVIRAAALERSDGVHGLDFEHQAHPEAATQGLADVLRSVTKDRIDRLGRLCDAVD